MRKAERRGRQMETGALAEIADGIAKKGGGLL